jgi:hypothetical protein
MLKIQRDLWYGGFYSHHMFEIESLYFIMTAVSSTV